MSSKLAVLLLILACCLLAACDNDDKGKKSSRPSPTDTPTRLQPAPTSPPAPTTAAPTTVPAEPTQPGAGQPTSPPAAPTPAAAAPTSAPQPAACKYAPTKKMVEVQDRALKEASALTASQRWPGVYWTLNDSGNSPMIYGVDEQGKSRGTFRVEGADNVDWEAIALGPGKDGSPALYIGDIGDNDERRRDLQIYRIPEPEPLAAASRPPSGRTAPAEMFRIAYPNGAHDAETMLVHPKTGEILIVTKDTPGKAVVFKVPMPLDPKNTMKMEKVADLNLAEAGVKSDVADDGAVTVDASRVVVRTYGHAVEFDVPPGASLASIWDQRPRLIKIEDPPQGEGITYRLDGKALISIGEDTPTFLWLTAQQC